MFLCVTYTTSSHTTFLAMYCQVSRVLLFKLVRRTVLKKQTLQGSTCWLAPRTGNEALPCHLKCHTSVSAV